MFANTYITASYLEYVKLYRAIRGRTFPSMCLCITNQFTLDFLSLNQWDLVQ